MAVLALGISLTLLAAGCAALFNLGLTPGSVRLSPGFAVLAPGEEVNFKARLFSFLGTEIPTFDEAFTWEVAPGGLDQDTWNGRVLRPGVVGSIDDRGRLRAITGVRRGEAVVGVVEATYVSSLTFLGGDALVLVDGDLDEGAPHAEVFPSDVRVAAGGVVPFVMVVRDAATNRVVSAGDVAWTVLEDGASSRINRASGVFTAGSAAEEVTVLGQHPSGRTDTGLVHVLEQTPEQLRSLEMVPGDLTLRPGLRQSFAAYGMDGTGLVAPLTGVTWSVEGGIGTVTPGEDGTAVFVGTSFGSGSLIARANGLEARRSVRITPEG